MSVLDNLTGRKDRLSEAKRTLLMKRLQGQKKRLADDAIKSQPPDGPAPLSYTQRRVWFLQQLFPESSAYNMHEAWRVYGPLDVAALEVALNTVVRQQAALRTSFITVGNDPMQQIADEVKLRIPVTDIGHFPSTERETELLRLARNSGNQTFDLTQPPLVRMDVVRLAREEFALFLTMHHSISDEWSIDIFWRELGAAYDRVLGNRAQDLAELPIQYTDYARWQRAQVAAGAFDRQASYWAAQLAGELPLLQLPCDRPRPATQSLCGGLTTRTISAALWDAIQALSQQAGATPYMTLLTAFQVLLSRYSNEGDIPVGTPIANRQRAETKDVMGMFINTAVMRADLTGNPSFIQAVDQVRQTALDALANQDLPFDLLVQAKDPERDLSHNPLFQTMFVFQSGEAGRTLSDMRLERIAVDRGVSKFDLTLLVGEEAGQLFATLEYNRDLFDETTATRMLAHWETLLQASVDNPHAPINSLPLLGDAERRLVLDEWNETDIPLPTQSCLHEIIHAQAAQHPHTPAVICHDQQMSYGELERRANHLAHQLISEGITPGVPVGLYVERSLAMIVGILGILKAGGAYVPLEPTYPAERIAFVLQDTQTPVIVTQAHLAARLPANAATIITLDNGERNHPESHDAMPQVSVTPDDLAYVIYTSGSTGAPKGVMVTHGNLLASTLARSAVYAAPVERYLLLSSFAFDSSVAGIFWTLAAGGALVLPAPDEEKNVSELATLISRAHVTHTLALPALYQLLLTYAPEGTLTSLNTVIVAGEACPPALAQRHDDLLPDCALYNEYGPTEATVWCTVYRLSPGDDRNPVPIGRPIPNYRIYILDSQQQTAPIGVSGELYIAGAGVTPGYWNNPALTAERFPDIGFDEHSEQVHAYRTGDLARWCADGQIEFLGRIDDQVKINGFRIEPGEIEAMLLRHPSVQEAAVLVHAQTDDTAQTNKSLVAYVVSDTETDVAILQTYLTEGLPQYLVPQQIIRMGALPRTPNGKVDRKRLPAPTGKQTTRQRPFVAPRTEAEQTLAQIWSDILRLPKVSVHDKFFELGGDSLMSIQAIARAQQAGLRLTPRQFFKEQTIARLAAVAEAPDKQTAMQLPDSGEVPLTPIQHWFFAQQLAQPNHWNQVGWFEATTKVDVIHLRRALAALMQRHPMLRARYQNHAGQWRQEIAPKAAPVTIERISLRGQTPDAQQAGLLDVANRVHTELDLAQGPLLRTVLFDFGEHLPQRVLLIVHHLIVDAVSWGIIGADLANAYRQIADGEDVSLPVAATSYPQWAQALTTLAQRDGMQKDADYWRQTSQLVPALPHDDRAIEGLHGDDNRAHNREGQSALIVASLDSDRTGQLLRDVHHAYHTDAQDLLLTALARTICQWTGENTTRLTLERHGREDIDPQLDVSRTVGWFTSLAPVTLTLDNPADLDANLRDVKEQLRSVPQKGVSYGILRYLGNANMRQQLAARPKPEILFNYLGQEVDFTGGNARLRLLTADIGQAYGAQNERAHLIDINTHVSGGCLVVKWQYPTALFAQATMQQLVGSYLRELASLIDHCIDVDRGRHTPSDFPLADLQQDDLDSLSDLLAGLN